MKRETTIQTPHQTLDMPLKPVGTILLIPTSSIHPMQVSPFPVREDASLLELTESISLFGVLHPIEVRPISGNAYQVISGARRLHACQTLGITNIPAIILELDDDEAILRMIDSNIQREYLLPSERAYAYKMRLEAMKRKAGRRSKKEKKNEPKISANFRSDDSLGTSAGISGDTVRNYISLTLLIPELMALVDDRRISLTPAYQLTALSEEEQQLLVDTIDSEQCTPSLSQAQRMRRLSKAGELNEDTMLQIMSEQKKTIKNNVTLSEDKLRKYFPRYYSPAKIETLVFQLLDAWHNHKQK